MGKIIDSLYDYVKKDYIFFTTPGHKKEVPFKDIDNLLDLDLTEIKGLDNLHNSSGCIKESMEFLSEFYNSYKSYYLLNGSTSGIHIMIFSCFNENDKVLVERGCHKSIINTFLLRKLKVLFIDREKYTMDILMPKGKKFINYDKEDMLLHDIKDKFKEDPDIKGVILTNPNYYGFYVNQEPIYKYLKDKGAFLLIDGAHGAHIRGFNKEILCINEFSDMSVMSAHKTLGCLTQGAYLHLNNKLLSENVSEYFNIFMTTSPSYLIMAFLENSIYDSIHKDGYIDKCRYIKEITPPSINYLDNKEVRLSTKNNFYHDDTRITLTLNDYSGKSFYEYLFKNNIVSEMNFINGVILIPTYNTKDYEFHSLYNVIRNFNPKIKEDNKILDMIPYVHNIKNIKELDPYEVKDKPYEFIEISKSFDRITYSDVFLYPPGTPILFRGERISHEHIDIILEYLNLNYEVNGVYDNIYFKVLKGIKL